MLRAVAVVLLLAACGGTPPPPAAPSAPSGSTTESEAPESADDNTPHTTEVEDQGVKIFLEEAAQREAPGARTIGLARASLEAGQHIDIPVRVLSGACVTAIAYAPGAAVDASFTLPGSDMVLAKSGGSGPLSVVGGQSTGGCWRNSQPFGGTITLRLAMLKPGGVNFQILSR